MLAIAVSASASGRPAPATRGRRPPPPGVRLRRGDLPTGRRQPWLVEYQTSLAGLGLDGGEHAPVAVLLSVTTTGAGFFVRGRLDSPALTLPCEACGTRVPVSLEAATFEVWLDPSGGGVNGGVDGGDADALPWPAHASAVDLTPAASGAGKAALPGRVVCGAPACAVVEWVAGREAGAAPLPVAGSAFGRLAGLKDRLLERQDRKLNDRRV